MNHTVYEKIRNNPSFSQLTHSRSRFGWGLSLVLLLVYFGFIATLAFAPQYLSKPIGSGFLSVGIFAGIGIILLCFFLTGLYVHKANGEFDTLSDSVYDALRED
ncbi:MAG: DUF485 domain-containing protein [Sulfurospirillum sp.]|nr:DUF485 domain-containing protein [Sulfurospirillum sp.]